MLNCCMNTLIEWYGVIYAFIIIKSAVKVHWICAFFKIMNRRQYGSLPFWKVYHQKKFMGYIFIGYFIFMRFKYQYTWILLLLCVLLMIHFSFDFDFYDNFFLHGLISFSNINFFSWSNKFVEYQLFFSAENCLKINLKCVNVFWMLHHCSENL